MFTAPIEQSECPTRLHRFLCSSYSAHFHTVPRLPKWNPIWWRTAPHCAYRNTNVCLWFRIIWSAWRTTYGIAFVGRTIWKARNICYFRFMGNFHPECNELSNSHYCDSLFYTYLFWPKMLAAGSSVSMGVLVRRDSKFEKLCALFWIIIFVFQNWIFLAENKNYFRLAATAVYCVCVIT